MPNPFPGMNPYLETRTIWPGVHAAMIPYIQEALQPQLRPKYIARIEERIQLAAFNQSYVPDVQIVHPLREPAPALEIGGSLIADEPLLITAPDEAFRESFLEIIARNSGDVVTVIEVLSPVNKGGEGRESYLKKTR